MDSSTERSALLRAAHRHLARDGTRMSVEDVLGEAGVNRRVFYRHFPSRAELIVAVQRETGHRLAAALRAVVDAAASPPEAVLAWMAEYLAVGYDERRAAEGRVLLAAEAADAPGLADAREEVHHEHLALLAEVLEAGRADGSMPLTEPARDAFVLHAVALRHVEARVRGRSSATRARVCDDVAAVVRTLLLGRAPPP